MPVSAPAPRGAGRWEHEQIRLIRQVHCMSTENSFVEVIGRLETGDKAAAEAVFNRFASQLLSLARRRLNSRLRQKVDA